LTKPNLYELWRLRLFSFGGYGLALAALALVVFGAIESPPNASTSVSVNLKQGFAFTKNEAQGNLGKPHGRQKVLPLTSRRHYNCRRKVCAIKFCCR